MSQVFNPLQLKTGHGAPPALAAGEAAWDLDNHVLYVGNLEGVGNTPAGPFNASAYETSAHASATYLPLAGGTLAGPLGLAVNKNLTLGAATIYHDGAHLNFYAGSGRTFWFSETIQCNTISAGPVSATTGTFSGNMRFGDGTAFNGGVSQPCEMAGFTIDCSGYGNQGLPAMFMGAYDRMMFGDKAGASPAVTITASTAPSYGDSVYNLIDGTPNMARWNALTALPLTLTFEFDAEQSYYRDFCMFFYPGYTPKDFSIAFFRADGSSSGATVSITGFPQRQCTYVCQEARSRYNTKKIVVTITALNDTATNFLGIVEATWAYYSSNPGMFPAYLHRGLGGSIFGSVDFKGGVASNGTTGKTGSVTLAKITSGGADGSLTFSNGILTGFVAPT